MYFSFLSQQTELLAPEFKMSLPPCLSICVFLSEAAPPCSPSPFYCVVLTTWTSICLIKMSLNVTERCGIILIRHCFRTICLIIWDLHIFPFGMLLCIFNIPFQSFTLKLMISCIFKDVCVRTLILKTMQMKRPIVAVIYPRGGQKTVQSMSLSSLTSSLRWRPHFLWHVRVDVIAVVRCFILDM